MRGIHHPASIVLAIGLFCGLGAVAGEPLPDGWMGGNGKDYETGVDKAVAKQGEAAAYIKSRTKSPENFGTVLQAFDADEYQGKRVRMSAYVKTDQVTGWAGLWMRVDGEGEKNRTLSFDNMQSRPIKGTLDWKKYEIVLDVPEESVRITFGILLDGPGQAWIDDFRFETVSKDVPVTGHSQQQGRKQPVSLGFEG